MNFVTALIVAGCVSGAGRGLKWLTYGGAAAAFVMGAVILAAGGLQSGILVALFFVSGSLLTQSSERAGLTPPGQISSQRSMAQVVANGFWAAAGAATVITAPNLGLCILAGAIAAAQADTWATEFGARARQLPRLITTGMPVPRGTSGGVTAIGTAAGVAGAVATAVAVALLNLPLAAVLSAVVGGTIGMTADSFLGAIFQARAEMSDDQERPTLSAMNDWVNFAATGTGATIGLTIGALWPTP